MANIENNSEKNDKQSSQFAKDQKLKSDVYDAIEEQLIKSTEAAFKSEGIKTRELKDAKEQQGWNKGVYGDGSTYGAGVAKGQDTVTINRVKGPKATNGFFEKNLSYGGKKMVADIHVDIDIESKTMDFTYQTTEQAAFRGYQDKTNGPYMINDKQTFKIDDLSEFKKNLKKVLDKFADKEAAYFFNTKLGIEDRTEKSINSMVESNMKKLSLTDIIKGNFNETLDKIMESTKKDVDQNHPEVKDENSPGNLLFDDKEEEEDTVDEVTASAGGAGAGAYLTPGAFKKGGDFDKEMKEGVHEKLQEKFEETEYSKKGKKRSLKRENNNGWTQVELEPGSGYVPKGMNKNYVSGLHGIDVNSSKEDKASKVGLSENFDPSKKKFVSLSENEEKGINKRYIITHQASKEDETKKWAKLSNFEKNSTIRIAESCGCPVEDGTTEKMVSREQGEVENEKEFMKRNSNVGHGDTVDGKAVVVVSKPGSLSGAEFKVFEDDYLNENKAFILDMNTGNLVNNPNYKNGVEVVVAEETTLNESFEPKASEAVIPNTAYYFNVELGKLIRNPNYKA